MSRRDQIAAQLGLTTGEADTIRALLNEFDVRDIAAVLAANTGSSGGGDVPFVGPDPPDTPTDGELWWDTDDNTPADGPQPTAYTITAAEIAARWDIGLGGGYVEIDTSPGDEIFLTVGAINTLDQGDSLGLYIADSGLTSAQVDAQADLSITAQDVSYVVTDGAQSSDPFQGFTVLTLPKALYLHVASNMPGSGDVTLYVLRMPLVAA